MKISTRIYLDAALQNLKSVTFFAFLQVLIARLGASNFEIALSNSLPPLFCALSLAFITRQLPVTKSVFLKSGYIRQCAFLCMALSVLMPNPIPYLLFFWSINAVAVMITSAQQLAIMRRCVQPGEFPSMFSLIKIIGIIITTVGSFVLGSVLDATNSFFPNNFVMSMLIGCLSTFTGMALIADLAPNEKQKIRFTWVRPFKECDRTIWWMGLNNIGIAMVSPLFIIYHVKTLNLSNTQIAYFIVISGVVSALFLPYAKRLMQRFSVVKVYASAVIIMALAIVPYGFISQLWQLIVIQGLVGVCLALHEVASQSIMMNEADKHKKEMDFFSDFQLVMNAGNAAGALITGVLVVVLPIWGCFITIAVIRLLFFGYYFVGERTKKSMNNL